jgi:GNAT superfamily N-acetyltransferase
LLGGCGASDKATQPVHHSEREAALGLTRELPRAYRQVCRKQAAEAPAGARACPPLIPAGPLKVLYRGRSLGRDSRSRYRGQGLGSALLEALMRALAGAGAERVSLSVEPDNPARRLYERAGFAKVGENGGSWTMVRRLR